MLRLSRGMSYKSAMANLKLGGGKTVVIGNPRTDKTPALLEALARAIENLKGRYIAAEDPGADRHEAAALLWRPGCARSGATDLAALW